MVFIQIGLALAYFVLASWLVIATFINFILKPHLFKGDYQVGDGVSWTYAILWGLVLTAPVAYGLLQ